jgi:hypothetical protein
MAIALLKKEANIPPPPIIIYRSYYNIKGIEEA